MAPPCLLCHSQARDAVLFVESHGKPDTHMPAVFPEHTSLDLPLDSPGLLLGMVSRTGTFARKSLGHRALPWQTGLGNKCMCRVVAHVGKSRKARWQTRSGPSACAQGGLWALAMDLSYVSF